MKLLPPSLERLEAKVVFRSSIRSNNDWQHPCLQFVGLFDEVFNVSVPSNISIGALELDKWDGSLGNLY